MAGRRWYGPEAVDRARRLEGDTHRFGRCVLSVLPGLASLCQWHIDLLHRRITKRLPERGRLWTRHCHLLTRDLPSLAHRSPPTIPVILLFHPDSSARGGPFHSAKRRSR